MQTIEDMVEHVRKLHLVKGDCVVITSDRAICQEQRIKIASGMQQVLLSLDLDPVPVVVLDQGLSITILRTSGVEHVDATQ